MKSKLLSQSRTIFPGLFLLFITIVYFFPLTGKSQTIRYQQSIRGGFTIAGNCLVDAPIADAGFGDNGQKLVNTAGGASMSSYADLILPPGSSIAKAFLYVEGYTLTQITSLKFKVPGSGFTTLNSASPGFINNLATNEAMFIIDVTSMMPANGYISNVVTGGDPAGTGRYAVADVTAFGTDNYGYGWSLIVVYTNPNSKYRNVTVADVNSAFGGTGCGTVATGPCIVTFDVNGISVPSAGAYNAIVAFTGTYGNDGTNDAVQFGKKGTTLTNLQDPTVNSASPASGTDLYNSTIGICANNNVSVDAALAGAPIPMSGNVVSRSPYSFTNPLLSTPVKWYSYFYDADIVDASGILPNSATPISVTFTQNSSSGDVIGGGAYVISVDIISAVITKSLSPASIVPGGTATYTWTIDNTLSGTLNLTGIGFTDNLPSNIIIANPPAATISGGTGGTVTAAAGGTSVKLTGLNLNANQKATMSVNVTNVPGQQNASCATNPIAFTNGFANVTGNTANLANGVTNQCLIVSITVPVSLLNFEAQLRKNEVHLGWSTASEKNNAFFEVQRSMNGSDYTAIGTVKGAGNSSITNDYSFTDEDITGGIRYYRLKQVDFNGKAEYSHLVSLDISKLVSNVTVSPQPVASQTEISFQSSTGGTVSISLFDITGRKILGQEVSATEGRNSVKLDFTSLQTGTYFLSIGSTSENYRETIRIMK